MRVRVEMVLKSDHLPAEDGDGSSLQQAPASQSKNDVST
jgi:hypothetical protein